MPRTSLSPFARVSSTAEAIRRRNEMEALERAGMQKVARIRVGVCAMDKKVRYTPAIFTCTALDSFVTGHGMHTYTGHSLQAISKPMQAILRRMNLIDEFEIVMFGDEVRSHTLTCSDSVASDSLRKSCAACVYKLYRSIDVHVLLNLRSPVGHTEPTCRGVAEVPSLAGLALPRLSSEESPGVCQPA